MKATGNTQYWEQLKAPPSCRCAQAHVRMRGVLTQRLEDSFQGLALSCLVGPETKLGLSDNPTELSLWSSIFISTFQQRKSCSTEKVTF